MKYSIKVRHRSAGSKPWKWEIFAGGHLVTASHDFFGTQFEAHRLGRDAVKQLQDGATTAAKTGKIPPAHLRA
jgi:hypothetical protein